MQFLVIARDGNDADAHKRRLAARDAHLKGARVMKQTGRMIEGGAILDDAGRMVGSAAIVDFADRAELDSWLETDPYVTGGVWRSVEVYPFRCAPWDGA